MGFFFFFLYETVRFQIKGPGISLYFHDGLHTPVNIIARGTGQGIADRRARGRTNRSRSGYTRPRAYRTPQQLSAAAAVFDYRGSRILYIYIYNCYCYPPSRVIFFFS